MPTTIKLGIAVEPIDAVPARKRMCYPELYLGDADLGELPEGDFKIEAVVCKRRYEESIDEEGEEKCSVTLAVKEITIPSKKGARGSEKIEKLVEEAVSRYAEKNT